MERPLSRKQIDTHPHALVSYIFSFFFSLFFFQLHSVRLSHMYLRHHSTHNDFTDENIVGSQSWDLWQFEKWNLKIYFCASSWPNGWPEGSKMVHMITWNVTHDNEPQIWLHHLVTYYITWKPCMSYKGQNTTDKM